MGVASLQRKENDCGTAGRPCLGRHVDMSLSYLILYTFGGGAGLYLGVRGVNRLVHKVAAMLKEENREESLR